MEHLKHKFLLDGAYESERVNGGAVAVLGEAEVWHYGGFEGKVAELANGQADAQLIRGNFDARDGIERLVFLQFPSREGLVEGKLYELQKETSDGRVSGAYKGTCREVSFKVENWLDLKNLDVFILGAESPALFEVSPGFLPLVGHAPAQLI